MGGALRRWDLRRVVILAVLVFTVSLTTILTIGFARGGGGGPMPFATLDDLEDEQVIFFEEQEIFLVSFDGEILALSSDAQHLGDDVEYCESAQLFESPAHGEKFDIRGYFYGGPARAGLDRYEVTVRDGEVFVDLDHPIDGPPRGAGPPRHPVGPLCIPT